MKNWNSGFRPKLLSGKLGPEEPMVIYIGSGTQVGRSCRIVRIKKALATEPRVKGALYVRLIGSGELHPLRESQTSREMELGTGDSG